MPGVWAAGDCCTVRAEAQAPQWFQMRLWTQVPRMQGCKNMAASPASPVYILQLTVQVSGLKLLSEHTC